MFNRQQLNNLILFMQRVEVTGEQEATEYVLLCNHIRKALQAEANKLVEEAPKKTRRKKETPAKPSKKGYNSEEK